jgi:hypothetical protein
MDAAAVRELDMCPPCADELVSIFHGQDVPDSVVQQHRARRLGTLGICGGHEQMLGPALYRMVKAGGFLPPDDEV